MAQKNFKLEANELDAFEAWCRRNNYNDKVVFLAGWRLLTTIGHQERMRYFADLDTWLKNGAAESALPGDGKPGKAGGTDAAKPTRQKTA